MCPQLLCWIACMLIDIINCIFANLHANTQHDNVLLVCLRFMIILYLSFQVIAISRICHLTCNQANTLASTIFSAEAPIFNHNEFLTEAIELGIFLRAHPLHTKVYGLFNLNSQFTFSVFGIIVMYVVLVSSIH
ncbi:PREDICTED: uncharacterized protein LOC105567295 isoform X2 [Vollenhovia emeryi]|uniref:uncharacterized protein LOC105567295 isoform X2 n=1 Tax=Vollenhovia emeryi TaxID=411798 RepID=UPI0005F4A956|nr:PREDICTED: uncharacterized protein LOC105567295 isoform X2 [Vollenhovia emeryi]